MLSVSVLTAAALVASTSAHRAANGAPHTHVAGGSHVKHGDGANVEGAVRVHGASHHGKQQHGDEHGHDGKHAKHIYGKRKHSLLTPSALLSTLLPRRPHHFHPHAALPSTFAFDDGSSPFACPSGPTPAVPLSAQGWGYVFSVPPPGYETYSPTAALEANELALYLTSITGELQCYCSSVSTTSASGDGNVYFNSSVTPAALSGCAFVETVATTPSVNKNISIAVGTCPTSGNALGTIPVLSWQPFDPNPNPQPKVCAAAAAVFPPEVRGYAPVPGLPGSVFALGANNVTQFNYGWMLQMQCALAITPLPSQPNNAFEVTVGAVFAGQQQVQSCMWLSLDVAGKQMTFQQGTSGATGPVCPTAFDATATVLPGWVAATW